MQFIIDGMQRVNVAIALSTTKFMSTMLCVYLFFVWSLIPLLFPNTTNFVAYISADIIQLVALSLIMVG